METDDNSNRMPIGNQKSREDERIILGEASAEVSLDALALDDRSTNQQKSGAACSTADGPSHASEFSFILAIGSPDSVKSTITMDPTIRFMHTSGLMLDDSASSTLHIPEISNSLSHDSFKNITSPRRRRRRLHPPANANRWMDDSSEYHKSFSSQTTYMGTLGLSNHLSQNTSYSELISNDASSSAFETDSGFTSCSFGPYNDDDDQVKQTTTTTHQDPYSSSPHSKNKNRHPKTNDKSQPSPSDEIMASLTMKMQQLMAAYNNNDTLEEEEGSSSPIQYNPRGLKPAFRDSLHSMNTLISLDDFRCNSTRDSASTDET